jgi:hypothetical protein
MLQGGREEAIKRRKRSARPLKARPVNQKSLVPTTIIQWLCTTIVRGLRRDGQPARTGAVELAHRVTTHRRHGHCDVFIRGSDQEHRDQLL